MRTRLVILTGILLFTGPCLVMAQNFITNNRLLLGTDSQKSASVRLGDLDGDGDLDAVVANGRHWPQQNYILINQGAGRFRTQRPLGRDRNSSYACELADLDGDGDLDIAVGNDLAPCQIFFNDGEGHFDQSKPFGSLASVRSITIADIDMDNDQDILVTCRVQANQIYLNDGSANFVMGPVFGTENDSTIAVAVADVNNDQRPDILVTNRDSQPNGWLINEGDLEFSQPLSFGDPRSNTRAVALGDFDADGNLDWAIGNIGQRNIVFLGAGDGQIKQKIEFADARSRTYCLNSVDLDNDGDLDLIAGNAGQTNEVFYNDGTGKSFKPEPFGVEDTATYGMAVGDVNGDRRPDIAVANSDSVNRIYIHRIAKDVTLKRDQFPTQNKQSVTSGSQRASADTKAGPHSTTQSDWPAFRGAGATGVAEGYSLAAAWNADPESGPLANILWKTEVPGLGHSSPVISGNRLFLLTAVAADGKAPLQVESGGKPTAADDNGEQQWLLLCYDKTDGALLWRSAIHTGKPRATRHAKATHANTSVCVSGDRIVAFLGSEGIHCFDLTGQKLWERDLGVINISKYGIGWGFASSPTIHADRIVIVCDDPKAPYVAALQLSDGQEVWRTNRKVVCERSWGTPLVYNVGNKSQVIVNGWPLIVSYDLENGKELWRLMGGGDNPVPTPFAADGRIYITNAHGGPAPIFAINPALAEGDISDIAKQAAEDGGARESSEGPVAWSTYKGGSYMSTPVVYRNQLYVGTTRGIIRSYNAKTGKKLFEKRLSRKNGKAGVISSLVAGDDKIYVAAENGIVYVLEQGTEMNIISENAMGAPCLASPAISAGTLFIRTTKELVAIRESESRSRD